MVQNVQMLNKYNGGGLQFKSQPANLYRKNGMRTKTKTRTRMVQRLFAVGLLMLALLSVSGLASAFLANEDVYAAVTQSNKQTTVYIEQGDTLWSIAEEHVSKGEDIREYVYNIKKLNGLKDKTLHVGQKLVLPSNR